MASGTRIIPAHGGGYRRSQWTYRGRSLRAHSSDETEHKFTDPTQGSSKPVSRPPEHRLAGLGLSEEATVASGT